MEDPSNPLQRAVAYIPFMESSEPKYTLMQEMSFDPYIYTEPVHDFISLLYELKLVVSMDWMAWMPEAERYTSDPERIQAADLDTLRRLFTCIIRSERLNSGTMAYMLDHGIVLRLLERLRELV